VLALLQDTLDREFSPVGDTSGLQVLPSVVPTIVDPPTAVHWESDTQEIDNAVNVESSMLHVEPPSLDFMMPSPPPA
jgi:hypothetical protein